MNPGNVVKPSQSTEANPSDSSVSESSENGFYRVDKPKSGGRHVHHDESEVDSANARLTWEASEYVDHEKTAGWYGLLAAGAVVVAVIAFFLTGGDVVTTVVVLIAAVLFGVVAARRPRTLQYTIDSHGVTIGDKLYPYAELKTFSLITNTPLHSIQLLPMKRFLPPIGLYFPPEHEQRIMETLGGFLPYEERGLDRFDQLMSRIRF
jgi:hypothetical protein